MFVSLSRLHHAIKAKEAERALEVAREIPRLPLRYEARVTALLSESWHPGYDEEARRFLMQAIQELGDAPLVELKKLADILAHVHDERWGLMARMALDEVVGQLHRRYRRLGLGFDTTDQSER